MYRPADTEGWQAKDAPWLLCPQLDCGLGLEKVFLTHCKIAILDLTFVYIGRAVATIPSLTVHIGSRLLAASFPLFFFPMLKTTNVCL
jgi:hypothetical protein